MENFRYLLDVTTLKLDIEKCNACGTCAIVCPHGVFEINAHKAHIVDRDGCMECGACATNCPEEAISVTPGVGCAEYIINGWIKGKENATCGGGNNCC
ncbi:MAG: mercury methylation ferredoxin HgcB [Desulfobacterales bacterium]|nr:mercury methylation ferredoxin HgcB [Desulfobacterales bacterium]MDJ0915822.1 mercury methylation ferredoxin HgcB [Desulfobacterales bacterium]